MFFITCTVTEKNVRHRTNERRKLFFILNDRAVVRHESSDHRTKKQIATLLAGRKIWQPEEMQRLAQLPLPQSAFYERVLRDLCDPVTQTVGMDARVTWDLLSHQFFIHSQQKLNRRQLRYLMDRLEAVGLICKLPCQNRLQFHLPFATDVVWLAHLLPSMNALESPAKKSSFAPLCVPLTASHNKENSKTCVPLCVPPDLVENSCELNGLERLVVYGLIPLCVPLPAKVCIFWQAYPVKKSKRRAKALFAKLVQDEEHFQQIMASIQAQKEERQCLQAKQQYDKRVFIPAWKYPTTWLSEGCWDDEVSESGTTFSEFTPLSELFPINADFSQIDYGGFEDE